MQPAASPQHRHDIKALDKQVADLIAGLKHLSRTDDLEELRLKVFPRPGWTTPAEFLLVSASVAALVAQVQAAAALKQQVVEASRTIGA